MNYENKIMRIIVIEKETIIIIRDFIFLRDRVVCEEIVCVKFVIAN